MNRLRCAVIGTGSMGQTHALNAEASGKARIVALCSRRIESAEALASRLGRKVALYTDHRKMLGQIQPDALFVCLPPGGHQGEVEEAAGREIHLFLEKPLALKENEAENMVRAAEAAGVITQVDFQHRFHPLVVRIKELLRSGEAGTASLLQGFYLCNSLHSSWWRREEISGGQLLEQVIHLFDLVLHLLGPAAGVVGFRDNICHREVPGYTIEDTSTACLVMKSGALVSLAASNCAVPGRWEAGFRLVCSRLMAEYSSLKTGTLRRTAGEERGVEEFPPETDLRRMALMDFLDSVREGKAAKVPIREAREAQNCIHRLLQSLKKEALVRI